MRPTISTQQTFAVIVELYYPAKDLTITDFLITPSTTHKSIIQSIRSRFKGQLEEVWPCDVNGEPIRTSEPSDLVDGDPVYNFGHVQNGERIILRLNEDERVVSEIKHKTVLYLGGDMGQDTFKAMSCQDRRNHIRMLRRSEAVQRKNIIRLTSPHTDVTLEPAKPRYSVALSSRIINENWKITLVCPLERDCLGVMAILSQATCGQPWVLECLLVNEITKIQTSHRILQERDVLKVIENLYEEADVIGTNWDNEAEQVTEAGETINL